jgi:tetratricopeptide (TPR) repeat protein
MVLEKFLNRRRRRYYGRRQPIAPLVAAAAGVILIGLLLVVLLTSSDHSDDLLRQASDAYQARDYELAAEEYERYLHEHPQSARTAEIRFQLANIFFLNLKDYSQARVHYRAFLSESPGDPNTELARERLAEALAEDGRSYEAIAEYENLNPVEATDRRRIRLRIADLYFDQRNYSQALTEYERVTDGAEYDELSERAYLREAAVFHLARSQFQQALPVYEKLATHSPDPKVRERAILGMSDCHAGLFQFDQAIKLLREIKTPGQQAYVSKRLAELENQKREVSRVPEMRWTRKTTVQDGEKAREKKEEDPPPKEPKDGKQ